MVKEKEKVKTVCLEPSEPCAREYNDRNIFEQVTVPDVSPSLYQMVTTATVGSMPGSSPAYQYPDLGDDDQAHDHPDYMKLNDLDIVEKNEFVDKWLENPDLYEKVEVKPKVDEQSEEDGESEEAESAKADGAGHV